MAETGASGATTAPVPATPEGLAAATTTNTPTDPRAQERPLENTTPSTPAQISQLLRAKLETQGYTSDIADEFVRQANSAALIADFKRSVSSRWL